MIDTNVTLGHHFLEIAKTRRVGNVPSHAQQDHFKRIVQPLQNLGDVRSKRRSWRHCLLHRVARAFSSASNFTSPTLMRQSPQHCLDGRARSIPSADLRKREDGSVKQWNAGAGVHQNRKALTGVECGVSDSVTFDHLFTFPKSASIAERMERQRKT
jgi:hypothetical protein